MALPRTSSFRLDGRHARGIGLAVMLVEAGARIVLAARTEAEIEAAVDAIRTTGGSTEALALDVTDPRAWTAP